MELLTIKTHAIEVPRSKQKAKSFLVSETNLPAFTDRVNRIISEFQSQGFTLFRLEFVSEEDDGELTAPRCSVQASRMETPEETEERVTRQTRYNDSQIAEHKKKIENAARQKEIKRLTEHLSTDELKALNKL